DLIVDGGPVEVGVESTIVGCFEQPMLLRPGGLPRENIERVLGRALAQPPQEMESDSAQPLAPGMLASHYAPRTRVRLNADNIAPYTTEERDLFRGRSPLVLRPGSTAEVAAICKLANEHRIALVPQGGNTGLVGGQTPHNGEVVVSLRRLDKIRDIDPASNTM